VKIDRKLLSKKLNNGEPIKLKFKYANREILMTLNGLVSKYLSKMDHPFLLNSLVTIIREVVVNAQKANAKRVFFAINNLKITNSKDYELGMKEFKNNIIGDFDSLEKEINKSDYYVLFEMNPINDDLEIKVKNNTAITKEELERINFRISKALQYNDFSQAYEEVDDESEGAGLGIVLTILFLKNMGIDPKVFKISTDGEITITSLVIPKDLKPPAITSKVKDEIANDIDGIPTFPENVLMIQKLINSSTSSIEQIAEKILQDPALSTDVIKLSNSAGFVPGKRIESVYDAVKTIGLRNVNAILIASNARKILNDRYSNFEQIWEHCNKVAFYSRTLGIALKKASIADNAFLGGLLHDLGKIILLSTDVKLVKTIADTVKDRKMTTSSVMEEISIGISHATIGEIIGQKWNFPDFLLQTIEHHHSPQAIEPKFKDLGNIVYLANIMSGIEERKYDFFHIDENILEKYSIGDENKFKALHEEIKKKYQEIK